MGKILPRSLAFVILLCSCLAFGQTVITTYQYDNSRSGTNTHETALTPNNVNVSQFGKLGVFSVQGYVYAQPLYVPNLVINGMTHNVLFVATEHDQVYAFDVNSGQQLWNANFLMSTNPQVMISTVSSSDVNCPDVGPEIGVTGTPVIDTSANTIYVVAKTKELNTQTHLTTFYYRVHALDVTTGGDKVSPRTVIALARGNGTGSIGGTIAFNALLANQRAALLLANGQVFVSWASYCDLGSYHGWLMSFDKNTLTPSGVFIDTPNGYEGGLWGGGSGTAADSSGSLYAVTGNGDYRVTANGTDYGDSVLRLNWSSSGITVRDYFTPWDQQTLDQNDTDVGSGGIVLLPDQSAPHPHLLIQVGKEGTIDLIDRDNMGRFHSGNDDQIVQTLPFAIGGVFGGPAFWNNNAYFGGYNDHAKAYAFNPQTELLSLAPTSETPEVFDFPGPSPVISSNGANNGITWIVQTDAWYRGGSAVLRAYKATNLGTELYNSQQNSGRDQAGLAVKFVVPAVADGRVFVAAQNQIAMYGLLN